MKLLKHPAIITFLVAIGSHASFADKVVVIPMISNDTELKPLNLDDVLNHSVEQSYLTDPFSSLFQVDSQYAWVITSITVYPSTYPATRAPIVVTLTDSNYVVDAFYVPNDGVTNLQFNPGIIYTDNEQYAIKVTDRGGVGQATDEITVKVNGYRVQK